MRRLKFEKPTPTEKRVALASTILLALMILAMIIVASRSIHIYSQEPISITGKLEDVLSHHGSYLDIRVDGSSYLLSKEKYSPRSFGIIDQKKLGDLHWMLDEHIGETASLVYAPYLYMKDSRVILGLNIGGVDYVNQDTAVRDFIGYEKATRNTGIALLLLLVAAYAIIRVYERSLK